MLLPMRFGKEGKEDKGVAENCFTPAQKGLEDTKPYDSKNYKPWYSSKFKNIQEVSQYW
ncbi:hypothetical protein [Rufibacter sp. XAAS-G3-1]|uniref:hypothetical protein n=1 Tax=Rufibacter sp. XAAS-G3-1 TaxID=2729134 RepID=UPI001C630D34|nr:hypothetical protein [Rufibacter sp. XAAS-G3-1]